jgi:hypothetical protein
LLDATRVRQLAIDNAIGMTTAYERLHEGIDVEASKRQTRSTPAPRQTTRHQGNPDGRLNRCGSCRDAGRRSLTAIPSHLSTDWR